MQQSKAKRRGCKFWLGLGLGTAAGWVIAQQSWIIRRLLSINAQHTLATQANQFKTGLLFEGTEETENFQVNHTIEDGIERIVYIPKNRCFETPILMQHGMFHGAWCWRLWQELFAEWGWESLAYSLPGHAGSPTQRPIALCTLDYYLSFLRAEVDRLPQRPVLMGHGMGGGLAQWYLKHVEDDLPAAVLVAPMTSHHLLPEGILRLLQLDPPSLPLIMWSWEATPLIRTPERAARLLITEGAAYSPEELHAKLGPESVLVLYQHHPPFWYPPEDVKTPMLWVAGEHDAMLGEADERCSAAHYKADYVVVEKTGHNLMMERNYRQTAEIIHDWLIEKGIK